MSKHSQIIKNDLTGIQIQTMEGQIQPRLKTVISNSNLIGIYVTSVK